MTDKPQNKTSSPNKLVALASIAAELDSVKYVAWEVSLAAKNAKIMSVQAGEQGKGFQPITQFINEISKQVMAGTSEITHAALDLSKLSVAEQRSADAVKRFEQVMQKDGTAIHIKTLSPAMTQIKNKRQAAATEFRKNFYQLIQLLEEMDQCMLSARAIASVSRIVTSDSGEYRDKLNVVANDLDESAKYIKEKLLSSNYHLNNAMRAIQNAT